MKGTAKGCVMDLPIKVGDREALPVRALPWLTNWNFGAGEVARALAGGDPAFAGIRAYELARPTSGHYHHEFWGQVADAIDDLDDGDDIGAYRRQATRALPSGAFVWRDEWEAAYNASPDGPDQLALIACTKEDEEDAARRRIDLAALIPADVEELVMEGFESPTTVAAEHAAAPSTPAVQPAADAALAAPALVHAPTAPAKRPEQAQAPAPAPPPGASAPLRFQDQATLWRPREPKRDDGLARVLYATLKALADNGSSRPSATQVMKSWMQSRPDGVIHVLADEVQFLARDGRVKTSSVKQLEVRIFEMTTPQRVRKTRRAAQAVATSTAPSPSPAPSPAPNLDPTPTALDR